MTNTLTRKLIVQWELPVGLLMHGCSDVKVRALHFEYDEFEALYCQHPCPRIFFVNLVFLVSNLRHGTIHLYGNTSNILWRDNRNNHCWTIRWQFSFSDLFTCNVVLTVHYIRWALALRRVFWEKQLWMQKVSACQAFKIYPDCLTVAEMGSFSNREFWRQQQEKRHLKINTCAIVTILRLSHLVRILQCWRKTLKLDWCPRR